MTETVEKTKVTGAGLTASRLIWNRFRAVPPGMLGRIYDLNPGLAGAGTYIPTGTIVLMPVPDDPDDEIVEQITLWG